MNDIFMFTVKSTITSTELKSQIFDAVGKGADMFEIVQGLCNIIQKIYMDNTEMHIGEIMQMEKIKKELLVRSFKDIKTCLKATVVLPNDIKKKLEFVENTIANVGVL